MSDSIFDKDLHLIKEFGRERVNGKSFENYLSGEEEYFKIIENMIAAMAPWKKDYYPNQFREKAIFIYRRFKSSLRKSEKTLDIKKKSIVFIPISETNIMLFEPIIKKFKIKDEAVVLRWDYSLDGLKKQLIKRDLPYVNYERYLTREVVDRSKILRSRYSDAWKISKKILKRNEKYERLRPVLKYFFGARNRFYEVVEFMEVIKKFIITEKPSMVVLPDETMDVLRATSYLCKKNKIPCIFIQDGSISKEIQENGETYALKKIVFGDYAKKIMIEKGMDPEKIYVAGSPLYDSLIKKKVSISEKEERIRKIGMKGKKIILFASTTNFDVARKRLEIILKIMKNNPSLGLIIKQHPGEYLNKKYDIFYESMAKKYDVKIFVSKDDMAKMLEISDIFITDYSTTILEALILKKPIILTNFEKLFDYESYPQFKGVIWHTYNYNDVDKAINYILKNKQSIEEEKFRKKLIKINLYRDDGKASDRIVRLIEDLKIKQ